MYDREFLPYQDCVAAGLGMVVPSTEVSSRLVTNCLDIVSF